MILCFIIIIIVIVSRNPIQIKPKTYFYERQYLKPKIKQFFAIEMLLEHFY